MANSLNDSVEDKYLYNPASTKNVELRNHGDSAQVGVVSPTKRFGRTDLVKSVNVSTRRSLRSIGIVVNDFKGLYCDELTLTIGERIEIISKDSCFS